MSTDAAPRAPHLHLPHVHHRALLLDAKAKSYLLTPTSTPPRCFAHRAAVQRSVEAAAATAPPRVIGTAALVRTKVATERSFPSSCRPQRGALGTAVRPTAWALLLGQPVSGHLQPHCWRQDLHAGVARLPDPSAAAAVPLCLTRVTVEGPCQWVSRPRFPLKSVPRHPTGNQSPSARRQWPGRRRPAHRGGAPLFLQVRCQPRFGQTMGVGPGRSHPPKQPRCTVTFNNFHWI
jgi:hypothetical protein